MTQAESSNISRFWKSHPQDIQHFIHKSGQVCGWNFRFPNFCLEVSRFLNFDLDLLTWVKCLHSGHFLPPPESCSGIGPNDQPFLTIIVHFNPIIGLKYRTMMSFWIGPIGVAFGRTVNFLMLWFHSVFYWMPWQECLSCNHPCRTCSYSVFMWSH